MSINGINNGLAPRPLTPSANGAAAIREQAIRPRSNPAPAQQVVQSPTSSRAAAKAPGAPSTLPAEAPAGTDPDLWSVLSADERSFFAKSGAMGPLTYGRIMASNANGPVPAVRGGRLDIRG
jgi:hypothetical protein